MFRRAKPSQSCTRPRQKRNRAERDVKDDPQALGFVEADLIRRADQVRERDGQPKDERAHKDHRQPRRLAGRHARRERSGQASDSTSLLGLSAVRSGEKGNRIVQGHG